MLDKLGNFIVKNKWYVVGVWIVLSGLIIGLGPKLADVTSNNQSSFLPNSYESVQAQNLAKKLFPRSNDATDIIVYKDTGGQPLNPSQLRDIQKITADINSSHLPHISGAVTTPLQLSPNKKVQLSQVSYSGNADDKSVINAAKTVRNKLAAETKGSALKAELTGQVATSYDTQGSFDKALKIVSIATIVLILILPAIVFRSPFIGLLPVLTVGLVYSVGSSLLAVAAKAFDFQISQQLSILFTVVLYGVGTDYILFLLFRYRERLRSGDHTPGAVAYALSRAAEAIASAALVVISSFFAMFFSKFGIFSTFAPGLVIMVSVMLLAALTLVPAVVAILGEKIFWPSKAWQSESMKPTISKRLGSLVARRPLWVSLAVIVVLAALALGSLGYKADFGSFSTPPSGSESAAAFKDLQSAFPAGALNPTLVFISSSEKLSQQKLGSLFTSLRHTPGVAAVLPPNVSSNGKDASISVILKDNPYSAAALNTVAGPLRTTAHSSGIKGQVLVGGLSSAFADVQAVTARDLKVIFPIAAAFIFVILALLLRSIVAPLYLLIAASLGFAATLGASVYIFTGIGSEAGLIFFLPIMLYVFVVAVGTDYNILTITRLREESRAGNDPRRAAELTVQHSSATVASAGLILAGTFISLLLARINFLTQMGSAIALGVALSAFVIAPLLIPSISALLGNAVWWPSRHKPAKSEDK
jgi:RND superfamily putative drug exporter